MSSGVILILLGAEEMNNGVGKKKKVILIHIYIFFSFELLSFWVMLSSWVSSGCSHLLYWKVFGLTENMLENFKGFFVFSVKCKK